MGQRKRILNLIWIMAISTAIVSAVTIATLYRTAFNEERARLIETAQSQARLIEAIARFDRRYSLDYPEGWQAAALTQISDAHGHYEGFGKTGEFTLSKRQGNQIVFLLRHRHHDLERPKPVSFDSGLAEPNKRALLGHSGTMVGMDYRGVKVLAAHEPVSELNLGLVAKIDMSEIRKPFVKTILIAALLSVLVVTGGAAFFIKLSNPIVRLLENHNVELRESNERLNGEIAERERTQTALQESERKYRQLVEQLQEGIWAIDKDAKTTYVNPRMAEMLGYTVDEMVSEHLFSFMDERGIEIAKRNLVRRKQGIKEQHDFELLHKNGSRIYTSMETAPILDEVGNFAGALACVADITRRKNAENALSGLNLELEERVEMRTARLKGEIAVRKQAEARLRENTRLLQTIFEGISEPLFMLDKEMKLLLMNESAALYHQTKPENAIGMPCFQAFKGKPEKCEMCSIPAAIESDKRSVIERKGFMDPDRTESVVVYPLPKNGGPEGGALVRISDITEEKLLQEKILQTEKLSALGFLVSGVAHEINNPNNFISFNLPILREYLEALIPIVDDYAEKHADFKLFAMTYPEFRTDLFKLIGNVEDGSRRINVAVSNLRGISRQKREPEMVWADLKEVLEKSVSICRVKINRMVKSFRVDIPGNMSPVYTDASAIELVTINLLINAVQAADKDESWIKLNVTMEDTPANQLVIEVSDNGCGMDEKTKSHIFDPFFTTKPPGEGTGLGLSLCYNSIVELGGSIEVESNTGVGTSFKIVLPLKQPRK